MSKTGLIKPTSDELEKITGVKPKEWGTYNKISIEELYGRVPVEIPVPHMNRVIVQFAALPEKTAGGIHLIDDERRLIHHGQTFGKILAFGKQAFASWHWKDQETPKVGEFWYLGRACGGEIVGYTAKGEEVHMQHVLDETVMSRVSDPRNFKFTT